VEILKEWKSILAGNSEVGLVFSSAENCYVATNKIQFTSNSFNFNGKEFCFQISYFSSSDLVTPILVINSGKFKVFARKPYVNRGKKETVAKRKIEEVKNVAFPRQGQCDEDRLLVENVDTKSAKKIKSDSTINGFNDFKDRLEELVEYNKNLSGTEKQNCMDAVFKCFLQADPKMSQRVMLNNLQSLVEN
jgi:hypothetical protein